MPLNLFYAMVQKKSKMTKNSNQGGSCLKQFGLNARIAQSRNPSRQDKAAG